MIAGMIACAIGIIAMSRSDINQLRTEIRTDTAAIIAQTAAMERHHSEQMLALHGRMVAIEVQLR